MNIWSVDCSVFAFLSISSWHLCTLYIYKHNISPDTHIISIHIARCSWFYGCVLLYGYYYCVELQFSRLPRRGFLRLSVYNMFPRRRRRVEFNLISRDLWTDRWWPNVYRVGRCSTYYIVYIRIYRING